MNVRCFISNSY